jgi:P-type Mg2+ transporter
VLTTTSANFGNMFSMAGASVLLPFLPLLATQILLNNFLSDLPAMAIAGDGVDPEMIRRPRRWDIKRLRDFMVTFGLVSSVFDFLTFGLLWFVLRTSPEVFRTAWFTESLLTELFVALIVRTQRRFWQSRPSALLGQLTAGVALLTVLLPYLPVRELFGFVPLSPLLLGLILGITLLYGAAVETTKRWFYNGHGEPSTVQPAEPRA